MPASSDGNVRVKVPSRKEVANGLKGLTALLETTLEEEKESGLAITVASNQVLTGAVGSFDGSDGVGLASFDLAKTGQSVEKVNVACDK